METLGTAMDAKGLPLHGDFQRPEEGGFMPLTFFANKGSLWAQ